MERGADGAASSSSGCIPYWPVASQPAGDWFADHLDPFWHVNQVALGRDWAVGGLVQ